MEYNSVSALLPAGTDGLKEFSLRVFWSSVLSLTVSFFWSLRSSLLLGPSVLFLSSFLPSVYFLSHSFVQATPALISTTAVSFGFPTCSFLSKPSSELLPERRSSGAWSSPGAAHTLPVSRAKTGVCVVRLWFGFCLLTSLHVQAHSWHIFCKRHFLLLESGINDWSSTKERGEKL